MNKLNLYLFNLSTKYILINLAIFTIFIMFLNVIDLARILSETDKGVINFIYLSILKFPSILNEILPFVTIIGISFLFRNLINNNEFISMRNIGYSIFDIFIPIGLSVFLIGLIFLLFLNPISVNFENKFDELTNKNDQSLYSIKISENEMWIKNQIDKNYSSFINIKNIDLKDMNAKKIKILLIKEKLNILIQSEEGKFSNNNFLLKNVKYYDLNNQNYQNLEKLILNINFNKENIINSIADYKSIPFYKYISHTKTLKKFNLYSPEIGLYYLSEILKPIFIVMLSFVVLGFSGKYKRNENFFKILFISISLGFLIFFLKEIINKMTITLSINFLISYFLIFFIPFIVGLYQVIKIEND